MQVIGQPAAGSVVPPPRYAGDQAPSIVLRSLGRSGYEATLARMREFTDARDAATPDEIWITEHAPVYTFGLAAGREHLLDAGGIPVIATDRGGQVTYHGPGQVVAYLLVDLNRRGLKVRGLVRLIEDALIATLAGVGVAGERQAGRPGVYVAGAKIAALGLKVRRGCSYHGASLNVDLDLAPFRGINPCGYAGLRSVSLKALGVTRRAADVGQSLGAHLAQTLEQFPLIVK